MGKAAHIKGKSSQGALYLLYDNTMEEEKSIKFIRKFRFYRCHEEWVREKTEISF